MIEAQNLTKRYPTRVAVDDVTFSVQSGEIVGFLGPNGAGKTTTMRVLTGFLPPTAGSARIAGHDIVTQSREARAAVGYLPETAALYPEMRVREYLTFRARLEGVPGAFVRQRVGEAIERCLLPDVADRRIENLSKGFRQRTSLAGALVHQPPVLIFDEPTIGLDPMQIIKIREMIRDLGRERAVLLSTHILPEVDAVCDRILIIARGRIVAEGTAAQLRQKFSQQPVFRAAFRGTVAAREALSALPGVTAVAEEPGEKETRVRLECAPDADPSEAVFQTAVSKGWVLRELTRDQPSLEEVFVRLTQDQDVPSSAEPAQGKPAEPEQPAPPLEAAAAPPVFAKASSSARASEGKSEDRS